MPSKRTGSLSAERAVAALGRDIRTARLKRRMPIRDFAERLGVSGRTVMRLEKGDPGIAVGTLAMACLVTGGLDRLSRVMDPAEDDVGLMLDRQNLPRRIRSRRPAEGRGPPGAGETDDEGVAF